MKLSVQVHLKANNTGAGVLVMDQLNLSHNRVNSWNLNKPGLATIPLFGDPCIDSLVIKGAVCDNSLPVTILFRYGAKRSDRNREWEARGVQWTKETTMSQFGGQIVTYIISK